jgi:putative peptidoglycan lipid II flippase
MAFIANPMIPEGEVAENQVKVAPLKSKARSVAAQTTSLAGITVLSPAAGLLAEIALAWRFGASGIVDAYRIIVLLLVYGQQLFVSYILPYVIVPIFAEYRAQGKEEEAWILSDSLGRLLLLFGALIAAFLFFFPTSVISIIAPGLVGDARVAALFFVRWVGLAFIPISWTGAACGILYAHDVFNVSPIAQLSSSLILFFAILFGSTKSGATTLVVGLLGGALVNTTIYTISLIRVRRQYRKPHMAKRFDLRTAYRGFRTAIPLLGSLIAGQSTSVVITRSLSRLPVGAIAAYGYAYKMMGLVQLVPNALNTVMFPKLSEAWYSNGEEEFASRCAKALRAALFIAVPLTAAAFAYRRSIVTLLLQRGKFSVSDVNSSSLLFGFLVLAVPAAAVTAYMDRMFYSLQETRIPVLMDITGNVLELAFIPFLALRFGAGGVAFAYMLLPWITGAGLLALFKRKIKRFAIREIGVFGLWIALMSAVSIGAGAWFGNFCTNLTHVGAVWSSLIDIAAGGLLSLILYFWFNFLLGFPEAKRSRDFLGRAVRTSFSYAFGSAS